MTQRAKIWPSSIKQYYLKLLEPNFLFFEKFCHFCQKMTKSGLNFDENSSFSKIVKKLKIFLILIFWPDRVWEVTDSGQK